MIVPPNMGQGVESALPPSMLAVLPKDPYDQLEIARKITSLAVSSRVGVLEAEANSLRQKLGERDVAVSSLQARVSDLQHELQQTSTRLASVLEDQDKLAEEKTALEFSVKKLTRDVAKLETFKKALMHSLRDDDEGSSPLVAEIPSTVTTPRVSAPSPVVQEPEPKARPTPASSHQQSLFNTDPKAKPTPANLPQQEPRVKGSIQQLFPLTQSTVGSLNVTPGLSPSDSPRRHSASNSPTKSRSNVSPPKRQPVKGSSAATSPNKARPKTISGSKESSKASSKWQSVNESPRLSVSSAPVSTSKHSTAPNSPPQIARTARLDGKEFFRQARNRLSYEQFSAFLANIKELNAHHQTREETLKKASDIFGAENADLYDAFNGLLSRHLPGET